MGLINDKTVNLRATLSQYSQVGQDSKPSQKVLKTSVQTPLEIKKGKSNGTET